MFSDSLMDLQKYKLFRIGSIVGINVGFTVVVTRVTVNPAIGEPTHDLIIIIIEVSGER